MARLTDQELIDLKGRALAAQISGARLANAEEHLFNLIGEVLELRKAEAPAPAATKVVVKGELSVQAAAPEKLAALRAALEEGENSPVSTDYSLEKILKKVDEPFAEESPAKEPEDDGEDEAPAAEPKATKKGSKRKK